MIDTLLCGKLEVHDVHAKPVAKKHIVVRAFTKKWCNLLTFFLQTSVEKLTGCTICGLISLAWKLQIRNNYIIIITEFSKEKGLIQPPGAIMARC